MDLRPRRWMVVGALALVGTTVVAGGAVAQAPPSSSATTSSTTTSSTAPEDPGTSAMSPTSTTEPAPSAPPDLTVSLTYACPVSSGTAAGQPVPVSQIAVEILNRGGAVEVDLVLDGAVVRRGIEVPFSYLGVPQRIWLALPEGDPDDGVSVEVVASGTGRPLGGAGMSNRPYCESITVSAPPGTPTEAPPATPTEATPAFTG